MNPYHDQWDISRDRDGGRLAGKRTRHAAGAPPGEMSKLATEPKAEGHMPRVGLPLSSVYRRLYYPFFTPTVLRVEYKAPTWPTSVNRGREDDRPPPERHFFPVQGRKASSLTTLCDCRALTGTRAHYPSPYQRRQSRARRHARDGNHAPKSFDPPTKPRPIL
jgi:hypothetical protein